VQAYVPNSKKTFVGGGYHALEFPHLYAFRSRDVKPCVLAWSVTAPDFAVVGGG
jgi:hypothetical protein